jgi:hypothetical protein
MAVDWSKFPIWASAPSSRNSAVTTYSAFTSAAEKRRAHERHDNFACSARPKTAVHARIVNLRSALDSELRNGAALRVRTPCAHGFGEAASGFGDERIDIGNPRYKRFGVERAVVRPSGKAVASRPAPIVCKAI